MRKALKNIGFFFLALIITAGIYLVVYLDKEAKQDILGYSLSMIGSEFMAMIPDGSMIIFDRDEGDGSNIFIINRDGSGEQRITDNVWRNWYPDWKK